MKILIVDQYYPQALLKIGNAQSKVSCYRMSHEVLIKTRFSTSDFYSKGLEKNKCEAIEVIINDNKSQRFWVKENGGIHLSPIEQFIDTNFISRFKQISDRFATIEQFKIIDKQIDSYKPDVIYLQNISYLNPIFLYLIKKKVRLVVGQIACPMPPKIFFKPYDLIITSFPHYIKKIRDYGINCKYLPLCFEKTILKEIGAKKRKYDVTFVGGISRSHKNGLNTLKYVSKHTKIDVWGYGKEILDAKSSLYKRHHGEAWGLDMYKVLLQSKITINRHIDVSEKYANNMRLFEATGCGTLLITDEKVNLKDLFEIGKEIVTYKDDKDLVKKIRYYLAHEKERAKIAKAGQQRTLNDHNYSARMRQLLKIIKNEYYTQN